MKSKNLLFKLSRLLISVSVVLMFCGVNSSMAADNPTPVNPLKLKHASYTTTATTFGAADEWWCSELEKRTGGRVKVTRYWAESLMKVSESFDGVAKGLADSALIPVPYFQSRLPLTSATELIYTTEKADAASLAATELYATYKPFQDEWEKQKVVVAYFHTTYPTSLATRKKITKLEDVKGLKIRGVGLISEALKLLGMTPVSLPAPEMYSSLERGVIDGASGLAVDWAMSMQLYEVAPYITNPGMGIYATVATIMNKNVYDKLPADIKKVVDDLRKEMPAKTSQIVMDKNLEWIKKGIAGGAKVYLLPDEELNRWKKVVVPKLWDEWLKSREKPGLPLKECLTNFRALLAKYEPKSKYVGPFEQYKALVKEKK